ncbi:MAG: hypothetical protein HY564_00520 [Candidatus Jacksonbacteria bacterium]|nr:hypothetical protein [Candidatus Jacksonbacteria bacterium]
MEQAIRDFAKQFAFAPKIEHSDKLIKADQYVLAGMGGSHLAGNVLLARKPELPITIWSDYGLPSIASHEKTLVIASSHSGDTEETLDAFETAQKAGYHTVAISKGGELLRAARISKTPFIELPSSDIQPRSALGFSTLALSCALWEKELEQELRTLYGTLNPDEYEKQGLELARRIFSRVPVIYASARNAGVAYNWKIKFNETGKIPAFYNVVPELNHNEMNGFDVTLATKALCGAFYFIFIDSVSDEPRVQKRMRILREMYESRGLSLESFHLEETSFQGIFSSLLIADWASFHTALLYARDPGPVPMIREFKNRMRE